MKLKTIVLAAAVALTSSLALAQPRLAVARTLEMERLSIADRLEPSVRIWIFKPIDHWLRNTIVRRTS
jgi:hypothetical protein